MSIKLESLANLKVFLQKTDDTDNDLLTSIIEKVSAEIETFLNRRLKSESREQFFNGGRNLYPLDAFPITTSPEIVIEVDGTAEDINDDFWVYEDEGLVEFLVPPIATEPKIVKITWTGGYAETTGVLAVPDDMKLACIEQSSYLYKRRDNLGSESTSLSDGSQSYVGAVKLLPGVVSLLMKHKKLPYVI